MDPYEAAKMRAEARAEHDEKFGKPEDMTDPRQNIPGEPIIVDAETYSKYENKPGPNGETVFLRGSGASRHVKPVWNDGGQVVTLKDIHDKYQTGVKYDFGKFSLDASFDSFPIGHKFRVCKDPWTLKGILETDRKRHKGQTRTICGDLEGEREKKLCTWPRVGASDGPHSCTGDPNAPKNIPVWEDEEGNKPGKVTGRYTTLDKISIWRDIWDKIVTVTGHYQLTPDGVKFIKVSVDNEERHIWCSDWGNGMAGTKIYNHPSYIPVGCILVPFDQTSVGIRVNRCLDGAEVLEIMSPEERQDIRSQINNGARPQGFENDYERKVKAVLKERGLRYPEDIPEKPKASTTTSPGDLKALIAEVGLKDEEIAALTDLGCESMDDMKCVTEDDLAGAGIRKIKARRMLQLVNQG